MQGNWLKRVSTLLLCGALHLAAHAADVLPVYLTGTWGTADSLYEGTDAQSAMYFLQDGFGMAVASTPPARRTDGSDDGKTALRAIVGFPFRATWAGEILTLHPFAPEGSGRRKKLGVSFPCNYDATALTLQCAFTGSPPIVLTRRSEAVPDEILRTIESARPPGK